MLNMEQVQERRYQKKLLAEYERVKAVANRALTIMKKVRVNHRLQASISTTHEFHYSRSVRTADFTTLKRRKNVIWSNLILPCDFLISSELRITGYCRANYQLTGNIFILRTTAIVGISSNQYPWGIMKFCVRGTEKNSTHFLYRVMQEALQAIYRIVMHIEIFPTVCSD